MEKNIVISKEYNSSSFYNRLYALKETSINAKR